MLEINQVSLKRYDKFSIYTIPAKAKNYGGYKTLIPNKYISRGGFERYINLPDDSRLKLQKGDDVQKVTIEELKRAL